MKKLLRITTTALGSLMVMCQQFDAYCSRKIEQNESNFNPNNLEHKCKKDFFEVKKEVSDFITFNESTLFNVGNNSDVLIDYYNKTIVSSLVAYGLLEKCNDDGYRAQIQSFLKRLRNEKEQGANDDDAEVSEICENIVSLLNGWIGNKSVQTFVKRGLYRNSVTDEMLEKIFNESFESVIGCIGDDNQYVLAALNQQIKGNYYASEKYNNGVQSLKTASDLFYNDWKVYFVQSSILKPLKNDRQDDCKGCPFVPEGAIVTTTEQVVENIGEKNIQKAEIYERQYVIPSTSVIEKYFASELVVEKENGTQKQELRWGNAILSNEERDEFFAKYETNNSEITDNLIREFFKNGKQKTIQQEEPQYVKESFEQRKLDLNDLNKMFQNFSEEDLKDEENLKDEQKIFEEDASIHETGANNKGTIYEEKIDTTVPQNGFQGGFTGNRKPEVDQERLNQNLDQRKQGGLNTFRTTIKIDENKININKNIEGQKNNQNNREIKQEKVGNFMGGNFKGGIDIPSIGNVQEIKIEPKQTIGNVQKVKIEPKQPKQPEQIKVRAGTGPSIPPAPPPPPAPPMIPTKTQTKTKGFETKTTTTTNTQPNLSRQEELEIARKNLKKRVNNGNSGNTTENLGNNNSRINPQGSGSGMGNNMDMGSQVKKTQGQGQKFFAEALERRIKLKKLKDNKNSNIANNTKLTGMPEIKLRKVDNDNNLNKKINYTGPDSVRTMSDAFKALLSNEKIYSIFVDALKSDATKNVFNDVIGDPLQGFCQKVLESKGNADLSVLTTALGINLKKAFNNEIVSIIINNKDLIKSTVGSGSDDKDVLLKKIEELIMMVLKSHHKTSDNFINKLTTEALKNNIKKEVEDFDTAKNKIIRLYENEVLKQVISILYISQVLQTYEMGYCNAGWIKAILNGESVLAEKYDENFTNQLINKPGKTLKELFKSKDNKVIGLEFLKNSKLESLKKGPANEKSTIATIIMGIYNTLMYKRFDENNVLASEPQPTKVNE